MEINFQKLSKENSQLKQKLQTFERNLQLANEAKKTFTIQQEQLEEPK